MGIGERGNFGCQPVCFVAEQQTDWKTRLPIEQIHCVNAGFDRGDFIMRLTQPSQRLNGIPSVFPRQCFLRPKSRFRNHILRRIPSDSREIQLFDPRPVASAKERPDVVETADVFEQQAHWQRADVFICRRGGRHTKGSSAVQRSTIPETRLL